MTEEQQDLRAALSAQFGQMLLALRGAKTLMSDEYLAEALESALLDYQTAVSDYIEDLEVSLRIKNVMDVINPSEQEPPF